MVLQAANTDYSSKIALENRTLPILPICNIPNLRTTIPTTILRIAALFVFKAYFRHIQLQHDGSLLSFRLSSLYIL